MTNPKVFISYSWSSQDHCDRIRHYAERLISDGVDTILDQWSLSEGQDKYKFMEKMMTDSSVTNVLIFSDKSYAEKADERKAGVGTESQIISKEIYDKIDQKKFIPIVCERNEAGEPYLPVFLKSRIWIDFSTPETANENWERLLRVIYDKPEYEKPALGKTPSFLTEDAGRPSLPTIGKFITLREALINQKPAVDLFRKDFLDAAISFADSLRVREDPRVEHIDEKVLEDLHKLLPLRDQFIDWLLLEASLQEPARLEVILTEFLEKILALKYRPPEVRSWSDAWFDAHGIFVYEIFLYVIAILIKAGKDANVRTLLTTPYILPESEAQRGRDFVYFSVFNARSSSLQYRNERLQLNRISLVADVIKERATRRDLPFEDVMQAELIVLLVTLLSEDRRWYPHTLLYAGHRFPLFVRATQRKYFSRLQTIIGVMTGDELRNKFNEGYQKHRVDQWSDFTFDSDVEFGNSMNMSALDTIA